MSRPGPDDQSRPGDLDRIFGLVHDELILSWGFVFEQAHPDAREQLTRYVEVSSEILDGTPIEYRIAQPGRGIRYLRSSITAVESGALYPKRIVGTVQDVTDQRTADREIAAHVSVSRVLADWDSFEDGGTRLLGGFAGAMGFVSGTLWLPDRDLLSPRLTWSDPSLGDVSELEAETLGLRIPRGVGVVGRAWEREAPVNVPDVLSTPDHHHRKAAGRAGVRGALAFPALHAGGVLAVLEFCSPEECRPSARFTDTMNAIGNLIGEFLARRQGQLRSSPLTRRELQVLQLAADGRSRSQTAERLTVSPATVATHMKHIFEKFDVGDRASAVAKGFRLGLID